MYRQGTFVSYKKKMPKTKDELNQIKIEYLALNDKLKELTDDELIEVTGGINLYSYVTVPNVVGISFEEAKNVITNLNLMYDSNYEHSTKEKDVVLSCDPLPGTIVPEGTKIILNLSLGR